MGRSVELDEDVYERIEALGRADEDVSQTIARLLEGPSLLDLVGAFDGDDLARLREARAEALAAEEAELAALADRLRERGFETESNGEESE